MPSDTNRIEEIVQAAYSPYVSRMDRPPAPMLRDFTDLVRAGDTWVLGRPAFAVISLRTSQPELVIENVAVHPSRQGQGLGRRLIEFAEAQARQRGLGRVTLYTNEVMTENIGLYEHLGYVEIGRRTDAGYRRVFMAKQIHDQAKPSAVQSEP